jgi:hypothetical protein
MSSSACFSSQLSRHDLPQAEPTRNVVKSRSKPEEGLFVVASTIAPVHQRNIKARFRREEFEANLEAAFALRRQLGNFVTSAIPFAPSVLATTAVRPASANRGADLPGGRR